MLSRFRAVVFTLALVLLLGTSVAEDQPAVPQIHTIDIGKGIALHYVDEGSGIALVFVHGSLSDGGYWAGQTGAFSKHYRAIAYSRRYDYPNVNPATPGYSAIVDSDDLAALIRTLSLGRVVVIGHSYGALAALFLAARHPELVRALVLAEPPAVSLLAHIEGGEAARGRTMYEDIQQRMVVPMRQAYKNGNREEGIRIFMSYVFADPNAWDKMSQSSRDETLKDAHEWDVIMTKGTLFPSISPRALRAITVPVLILSGAKSYPFLGVIGRELARLLPNSRTIVFPNDGHQMWLQDPEACRNDVMKFLSDQGIAEGGK